MLHIHIGEMIDARLKEIGMSKAELGRRIHTSRQNINTITGKASIDVHTLVNVSNALVINYLEMFARKVRNSSQLNIQKEEFDKLIRDGIDRGLRNGVGESIRQGTERGVDQGLVRLAEEVKRVIGRLEIRINSLEENLLSTPLAQVVSLLPPPEEEGLPS